MKLARRIYALSTLIWVLALIFCFSARAQEKPIIQTKYLDTYTLDNTQNVKIDKEIELINTTSTMYASEYELAFSNFERIGSMTVFEEGIRGDFSQARQGEMLKIRVKFREPALGKGASKKIRISYSLNNYLNQFGVHRELLMPLSKPSQSEDLLAYEVRVVVPPDYPELGISKPKVTKLSETVYYWPNVLEFENEALYLSFSDKAYYQVKLNYLLANNAPYKQKMQVALVPDGTFQKSFLEKIDPLPDNVSTDADGNMLASYQVPAQTVLKIHYQGYVILSTKPQSEMLSYQKTLAESSLSRYLTQENYWRLRSDILADPEIVDLEGSLAIYDYIVDKLDYSTERLNQKLKRQGAEWVYDNPEKAVCMEYSDLFIALSREKGIPSREVVGYGLTADRSLLPLSFLGDVLHAWPEYYDSARQVWLAVDPTWGDTAKIDYFHSFDLSHITFVYHGKDPQTPLPPGVYKLNPQSKDIVVSPVSQEPKRRSKLSAEFVQPLIFGLEQTNPLAIKLYSEGNTTEYFVKLALRDKTSKKTLSSKTVKLIEPLSSKELKMRLSGQQLRLGSKQTLELVINGRVIKEASYSVLSPGTMFLKNYGIWLSLPGLLLVAFALVKWRL
jgi:transglutaminase-like putative cysteine protease